METKTQWRLGAARCPRARLGPLVRHHAIATELRTQPTGPCPLSVRQPVRGLSPPSEVGAESLMGIPLLLLLRDNSSRNHRPYCLRVLCDLPKVSGQLVGESGLNSGLLHPELSFLPRSLLLLPRFSRWRYRDSGTWASKLASSLGLGPGSLQPWRSLL